MPFQPKMDSIIIEPDNRLPICIHMLVTFGSIAFLITRRNSTILSGSHFDSAVVVKSSFLICDTLLFIVIKSLAVRNRIKMDKGKTI